jgi:hypothetical protein
MAECGSRPENSGGLFVDRVAYGREGVPLLTEPLALSFVRRHMSRLFSCLALAASVAVPVLSHAVNAPEASTVFKPGALWPDDKGVHINAHGGGILFENGTYYWFGEHKVAGVAGNHAHVGVHVYSSKNLGDWKDEGIALAVSEDPESPITKGCIIERPKVVKNAAGKFVMWFHLERKQYPDRTDAMSGVAIADRPQGPYVFLKAGRRNPGVLPLNATEEDRKPFDAEAAAAFHAALGDAKAGHYPATLFRGDHPGSLVLRHDLKDGQAAKDMTLFRDDDGKIYHLATSEGNGTLHVSLLTPDALSDSGKYIRIFPGRFNEAPAVFRKDGKYYMFTSGCSGWAPNAGRLSVADSMLGEWKSLGNPCRGTPAEVAKTFGGQSTHVLPVAGMPGKFIFMGDLWRPWDAIDGRYLWLPVEFENGAPVIRFHKEWKLSETK